MFLQRALLRGGELVFEMTGAQVSPQADQPGPVRQKAAEPSAEELVDRAKAAPSLMFRASDLLLTPMADGCWRRGRGYGIISPWLNRCHS